MCRSPVTGSALLLPLPLPHRSPRRSARPPPPVSPLSPLPPASARRCPHHTPPLALLHLPSSTASARRDSSHPAAGRLPLLSALPPPLSPSPLLFSHRSPPPPRYALPSSSGSVP